MKVRLCVWSLGAAIVVALVLGLCVPVGADPGVLAADPGAIGAEADVLGAEAAIQLTYLRGKDRYETALQISQAMFPEALSPGSGLVLAPGETFPEALCGGPLAAAWGGPVLLTPAAGLNSGIIAEIQRLQPDQVFCVGLAAEVAAAVQAAEGPDIAVTSITGTDVYELSYRVARALAERVNATGGDISLATTIVTMGRRFPDAIGVSPLACAHRWPILLTEAADGGPLNAFAAQTLAELGITAALKVGTYAGLPEEVEGVTNLSGSDRYQTNRNVVDWAQAHAGLSYAHTGLATGDKFPDALAAGPYLARDNGLLLLTPVSGPIPACVAAALEGNASGIDHLSFIAMVETVLRQGRSLVGLPASPFPPADDGVLTVAAGGDVLGGRKVAPYIDAYGGEALFVNVRRFLTPADVTFVNLEGPISDKGSPIYPSGPVFEARPALMDGLLSAGVDVVSLGNNHMLDYGPSALLDCVARLDAAGVKHAGAGANLAAAFAPAIWDTPDGTVGLLAYCDINDNIYSATATKPGIAPFPSDRGVILSQVRAAAQQVDFLVVSFHWGVETDYTVNAAERSLAHQVIDAGADLILGHHPHVVQGLEVYKDKLIAYSLGNFVFDHNRTDWGESFLLQVTLPREGPPRGEIIPVYLSSAGVPSPVTGSAASVTLNRLTGLSATLGLTLTRWGDQAFFGYP